MGPLYVRRRGLSARFFQALNARYLINLAAPGNSPWGSAVERFKPLNSQGATL